MGFHHNASPCVSFVHREICSFCFDDILICSLTMDEHVNHIKHVFKTSRMSAL